VFRAPSASSVALALLFLAPALHATEEDDKRVCLSTYVDAQATRREGKLRASRRALEQCGRAECPALIRKDCVQWMREVTDAMPTVVLSAIGPDGGERTDVRVLVDGEPLVARLDGRSQSVDPGEHVFRFELPGVGDVEQRVLVREGEKDRPVVGAFAREVSAPIAGRPGTMRPVPTSVWVLGGLGATSLIVSATFAGLGWFGSPGWVSSQSCKPNCAPGEVSVVKEHFEVADVAGGVAFVSLGAAALVFFTRPERSAPPPVSFTVGPRAIGTSFTASF
jgi:hypothetical protein